MQYLRGEMQFQMNRLEREGETTMIHPGARHDIIISHNIIYHNTDMTS